MTNPFAFIAFLYCLKQSYDARAFRPWGFMALLIFLATLWEPASIGR